jgi:hypothetical protein
VAALLAENDWLICDQGRKTKSIRIPGEGTRRLYHIPSAFLEADHDT